MTTSRCPGATSTGLDFNVIGSLIEVDRFDVIGEHLEAPGKDVFAAGLPHDFAKETDPSNLKLAMRKQTVMLRRKVDPEKGGVVDLHLPQVDKF